MRDLRVRKGQTRRIESRYLECWGERTLRNDPAGTFWVASTYANTPSLRDRGIAMLEEHIAGIRSGTWITRPAAFNRADFATLRDRTLAERLTVLGQALLARGDADAALEVLKEAGGTGWSPARFRAVADILAVRGEHAKATALYARLVADPSTRTALADSIRTRNAAQPGWDAALQQARSDLMAYYRSEAIAQWPIRDRLRLADVDGKEQAFTLAGDQPTLVAIWSPNCPPSIYQLQQLDEIGRRAQAQGFRVLIVTDERPSAEIVDIARKRGLQLPFYFDTQRDAANAFEHRTPRYIVLDREGRIRFTHYAIDDLPAKLLVVAQPD